MSTYQDDQTSPSFRPPARSDHAPILGLFLPFHHPPLPSFLMTQSYFSISPAVWHSQPATATQFTPLFCVWTCATQTACHGCHGAVILLPFMSPIYKTYQEVIGSITGLFFSPTSLSFYFYTSIFIKLSQDDLR